MLFTAQRGWWSGGVEGWEMVEEGNGVKEKVGCDCGEGILALAVNAKSRDNLGSGDKC